MNGFVMTALLKDISFFDNFTFIKIQKMKKIVKD